MTEDNQIKSRLQQTLAEVAGQTDITGSDEYTGVVVLTASVPPSNGSGVRRWARASLAAAAVMALVIGGLAYARSDGGDTIETAGNGAGASGGSGLPRYLPDWLPDGYRLTGFHETDDPRSSELVWVNADGNQLTLEISNPPVPPIPSNAYTTLLFPAAGDPDSPICFPEPCSSTQGDSGIPGTLATPPTESEAPAVGDRTAEGTDAAGTALIWGRDGSQLLLTSTFGSGFEFGTPTGPTPYDPDDDRTTDDVPGSMGDGVVPGSTGSGAITGSVPGQAAAVTAVTGDEPMESAATTTPGAPVPLPPEGIEVEARSVEPTSAAGVVVDPSTDDRSAPGSTIGPAETEVVPAPIDSIGLIWPSPEAAALSLTLDELAVVAESVREVSEDEFQAYIAGVEEPRVNLPEVEPVPGLPENSPEAQALEPSPTTTSPDPAAPGQVDPVDPLAGPTTTMPPITLPLDQLDIVCMLLGSVVSPDLDERVDAQPMLDLYDALVESLVADQPGAAEDMVTYRDGVLELIAASPDGLVSQADLIELSLELNDC